LLVLGAIDVSLLAALLCDIGVVRSAVVETMDRTGQQRSSAAGPDAQQLDDAAELH